MNEIQSTSHITCDVAFTNTEVPSVFATLTAADWARFDRYFRPSDGCWLWSGSRIPGGYGQFTWGVKADGKRKSAYAHRLAWVRAHGPIVPDEHVCHHCDTRHCVNPSHLFLGNQDLNMKDAASKGRLSMPRPYRQKVTAEQVAEMIRLRACGWKLVRIADRFNVSKAFVSLIAKGKRRVYTAPQYQPIAQRRSA